MRENNAKIQKIQKSSNVAFILVKIMKIFCITMSVITIVCGCGFIGVPQLVHRAVVGRVADLLAAGGSGVDVEGGGQASFLD